MKITSARFVRSALSPRDFPTDSLPEVAFLGRSNVGKSSLINSLLGKRGLARTSNTPGRTQAINFFLVNERVYFADLPGYGYAKVPLAMKKHWAGLAENYLAERPQLVLCIVILDSRHKPTAQDQQLIAWLRHRRVPYAVVATKADKLSNNQLRASVAQICAELETNEIIPYSSPTRFGVERVWRAIDDSVGGRQGPAPGPK